MSRIEWDYATKAMEVNKILPVGKRPIACAMMGETLCVAKEWSCTISFIARDNSKQMKIIETVTVGSSPFALAAMGETLCVASNKPNTMSFVRKNYATNIMEVMQKPQVGKSPMALTTLVPQEVNPIEKQLVEMYQNHKFTDITFFFNN